MKILFIGDVFGSIGREMIEDYLHRIIISGNSSHDNGKSYF